jgi:polyphenol oxidase
MEHFSFRHHQGIQFLVCEPIEKVGFTNGFSTRHGGVPRFLAALSASEWQLVTARQIHSAIIRSVGDPQDTRGECGQFWRPIADCGLGEEINPQSAIGLQNWPQSIELAACDAVTANIERTLLGVQTADCLPVLIADERTGAFAAIHAGWRGTLAGIVARTVEQMQLEYDSQPAGLLAAFGPAIGACCFEVGPEVLAQFREKYNYTEELIAKHLADGRACLDLNRANRMQLAECGLPEGRIYESRLCTVCRNDLFFSYRGERGSDQPVGRFFGVIGRASQIINGS